MSPPPTSGAVSSGHPSTTEAGLFAFRRGGNAMDAAIAAALAATICEPQLTGLGGGGLLTVRHGRTGVVEVVDAFARFPGLEGGLHPGEFEAIRIDYGPLDQAFHAGCGAVSVPGAAAGLEFAHRRWGRLPLSVLAEPAAHLARNGWVATPTTEVVSNALAPITRRNAEASALYLPGGEPLRCGAVVRSETQARAIEDFGREGAEPFVSGRHARALAERMGRPAGSLSLLDLRSFSSSSLPPISVKLGSATLHLPGPPCVGGMLVAFGLTLLERVGRGDGLIDGPQRLAAVMHLMERVRAELLVDPFVPDLVALVLSQEHIERRSAQFFAILERRTAPVVESSADSLLGNTTHVSTIDGEGSAVAWTSSLGETCGDLWPGLDLPVNNFLGEEDLHPRGFHVGTPGRSLMTGMTPSILERADGSIIVLGTGGANRIRTTMLTVATRLAGGSTLSDAVESPRLHIEGTIASIEREPERPGLSEAMRAIGLEPKSFASNHLYFGGVHAVERRSNGELIAVGDARRTGVGAIFPIPG